jgi:hypothetical protein
MKVPNGSIIGTAQKSYCLLIAFSIIHRAAEMLSGLQDSKEDEDENGMDVDDHQTGYDYPTQMKSTKERDQYLLALSYFHAREYLRAAHALRQSDSSQSMFLRLYALYLVR